MQFAWDSVSLTTALSCPLRYKLEIIDGWTSKSPDAHVALVFGLLLHAGVEQYHRLRVGGVKYDESVVGALGHVQAWRDPRLSPSPLVNQLPTDEELVEAKEEHDPDEDDEGPLRNAKLRTRYHLFRALVWYFDQYRQDHLKVVQLANGDAAVEHSFRVPIGQKLSDGTDLLLAGHYDKLVDFNGERFVTDLKSTKTLTRTWRKSFDLNHQMTGYTLSAKIGLSQPVRGVFIDAVQLQVGGVKFSRFPTYRSKSQLAEYIQLLKYVADQAEMWFQNDYYPQNTSACFMCQFKEVCAKPKEFRDQMLKTYFEQKPAWNPLRSR